MCLCIYFLILFEQYFTTKYGQICVFKCVCVSRRCVCVEGRGISTKRDVHTRDTRRLRAYFDSGEFNIAICCGETANGDNG